VSAPTGPATRSRGDRCPGACRPWPADDGLLVRLRLIGGRVASSSLKALIEVAETYGDGRIRLTRRANLQLRGLPAATVVPAPRGPGQGGQAGQDVSTPALDPDVLGALVRTGLLPSISHELARNVMVSPQTGLAGGRANLRPVAAELDHLLCADAALAQLPGRFLFVLDDGRGDLVDRSLDLGLVALDGVSGQLRAGREWGPVVPLDDAAAALAGLATSFVLERGSGPTAAWHVSELRALLVAAEPRDVRAPQPSAPLPFGDVPGGRHVAAADGLDRAAVEELTDGVPEVVVTPWRGVLVPQEAADV
jgi:precorrin-3B synthase